MTDFLNYDDMRKRADDVMLWWKNTTLDPGSDLTHETNGRCGRVLNWIKNTDNPDNRTVDNRVKFLHAVYDAEIWIRALKYKGNA